MTPTDAYDIYRLAAALRAVTAAVVPRVDDDRPSEQLAGLALAAEHLAAYLADKAWQLVEESVVDHAHAAGADLPEQGVPA